MSKALSSALTKEELQWNGSQFVFKEPADSMMIEFLLGKRMTVSDAVYTFKKEAAAPKE